MSMSERVLVAGGGVVGCLTALELAARGCSVLSETSRRLQQRLDRYEFRHRWF